MGSERAFGNPRIRTKIRSGEIDSCSFPLTLCETGGKFIKKIINIGFGNKTMRVSAKGEYALLAIYELAKKYESDEVLTIDAIAHNQDIPHPFLVQILQELKKAGFIESRRGAGGGYMLTCHPKDISVGQVIRQIDGPILPFRCEISSGHPRCPRARTCPINYIWDDVRHSIESVLDQTTFERILSGRHFNE